MNREPNAQLIAVMNEAVVSNKGLAKRMRDHAAHRGDNLGTTHIAVQRWRDGAGIQPKTAAIMAHVMSSKLRRRLTPNDLGFPDPFEAAASPTSGYPETFADALTMLEETTEERADTPSKLIVPDSDTSAAVLSWMVSRPDGLQPDRPASQRVGMRDVRAVRTAADMFMQLDFLIRHTSGTP